MSEVSNSSNSSENILVGSVINNTDDLSPALSPHPSYSYSRVAEMSPPVAQEAAHELKGWSRCQHPPCSREDNCSDPGFVRCCVDLLQELLEASDEFLKLHNLSYYVFWGTLLGSVRNDSIIPYTSDVDLVVERADLSVLEGIERWNSRYYFWVENPDIGRLCLRDLQSPGSVRWGKSFSDVPVYVDFYTPLHVPDSDGGKTVFPVVANCVFQSKLIYNDNQSATPFKIGKIKQLEVPMPSQPEKLLEQIYGSGWDEPVNLGGHGKAIQCPMDHAVTFNRFVREGRISLSKVV